MAEFTASHALRAHLRSWFRTIRINTWASVMVNGWATGTCPRDSRSTHVDIARRKGEFRAGSVRFTDFRVSITSCQAADSSLMDVTGDGKRLRPQACLQHKEEQGRKTLAPRPPEDERSQNRIYTHAARNASLNRGFHVPRLGMSTRMPHPDDEEKLLSRERRIAP